MKKELKILFFVVLLSLSTFNPTMALTKTDIKNGIKLFFETPETKSEREDRQIQEDYINRQRAIQKAEEEEKQKQKQKKEEENKQLYNEYFLAIDNKYKKMSDDLEKLAKLGYSDDAQIQKEYNKYLSDRNNMEHNRYLCDTAEKWTEEYKSIVKSIDDAYKQAYEKMRKSQTEEEYKQFYTKSGESQISDSEYLQVSPMEYNEFKKNNPNLEGFNFSIILNEKIKKFEKIDEEVSKYSYAYEQKKVANFMMTHKRKKLRGVITSFVYMPMAGSPQIGALYSYNIASDFPLTVTQVLHNGVLVTGDYSIGYTGMKHIFIQTNQKFVTNQRLYDYGMYEYVGIMYYQTILGGQNAVWKFRQLSKSEIKKNFDIGNPLYFYYQY